MNKLKLALLSFIPLLLGFFVHLLVRNLRFITLFAIASGSITLIVWFFAGRYAKKLTTKAVEALCFGNFVGLILALVYMIFIFTGIPKGLDLLNIMAQVYHLPVIGIIARLDVLNLIRSTHAFILVSAIVMLGVFYLGYRNSKREAS